jgi:Na+/H+ antiporter NhaC
MLEAERRARRGQPLKQGTQVVRIRSEELREGPHKDKAWPRILLAFGSIALMLTFALVSFYITGRQEAIAQGLISVDTGFRFADLSTIIGCADTIQLVMESAIFAGIVALLGGMFFHLFSLSDGILAWIEGASSLMSTIVVLVLAWTLAGTVDKLGTVYYVVDLIQAGVPQFFVPTLIFMTCCVISFAAGSYGCMFMVMPIAVPIVAAVGGIAPNPAADPFMLSCVAAVLSGAIFGDHCSPMTDCTILAALGAGCETMDHVRTQMPYAITVAITSVLFGTLLTSFGVSPFLGLLLGLVFMGAVIQSIGKKP